MVCGKNVLFCDEASILIQIVFQWLLQQSLPVMLRLFTHSRQTLTPNNPLLAQSRGRLEKLEAKRLLLW